MSPAADYSFLPWLRQGLANEITAGDLDQDVALRPAVRVQLELAGEKLDGSEEVENISRDVSLYGPGDILGIDSKAIFKIEPRHWITNFEPNYMPFIEFYDEDFPWRYTPAAPGGGRLRPWIALVVLEEGEFAEGREFQKRPLPYIQVSDVQLFPPAGQLWAWAHVHVNRSLAAGSEIVSNDMNAVLPRLRAALTQDPDLGYSRLLCPRKLKPNAAYHAFLLPVFESGRLAGLGLDPAKTPYATFSSWEPYPQGVREEPEYYPYYHRWFFRTGTVGDFEYLVRLLQPRPADSRVGRRPVDVLHPGANLPVIDNPGLEGVLLLGGALQVPDEILKEEELEAVERYEDWDQPYPHTFQGKLAALVNLADAYTDQPAQDANDAAGLGELQGDPDPLITPPIYGRWHALTERLLTARDGQPLEPDDNWVHELNLDPRFRAAAGFGTQVVQKHQEDYMLAAWQQVGEVLEANRRIRLTQASEAISLAWYYRHLASLQENRVERALTLTAPLHSRVLSGRFTAARQVSASVLTPAVVSPAFRRILRPGGRVMRALQFDERVRPDNLLQRMNSEEDVTAAPPKVLPPGLPSSEGAAGEVGPELPSWLEDILENLPWLGSLLWALAVLLLILLGLLGGVVGLVIGLIAAAVLVLAARALSELERRKRLAGSLRLENQTPEAVEALPEPPGFRFSSPVDGPLPAPAGSSREGALRFKSALVDAHTLLVAGRAAAETPLRARLDLPALTHDVVSALDPAVTITRRLRGNILLPGRLAQPEDEPLQEVWAYPELDYPMYKPLADLSSELFLPNLQYIEQNSISLLETNQRFIEAYMVGLNHEFARELLWREYPTDQRGSYFRQFWDVSGYLSAADGDPQALREQLKDIPPIHLWRPGSRLGEHDQREANGETEEEVVLVIRGELLKKYPTAVIYAQAAEWQRSEDGSIDNTQERTLVDLTAAEESNPPRHKVKTPLYEAKIEPDIYFFGFDLKIEEARGGTGENDGDPPGWFFVIKERPGEPRFGLDINPQPEINTWNDLSWEDVLPGEPGAYLQITPATPAISVTLPGSGSEEKQDQYEDDRHVQWSASASAADLAYILYQSPVMVAVHAAEMLPKP